MQHGAKFLQAAQMEPYLWLTRWVTEIIRVLFLPTFWVDNNVLGFT
jgi:hypothetical protein